MRFDKFTLKVQEALQDAQSLAGSLGHQAIEPEHLLVCFLKQQDSIVSAIVNKLNASPQKIEQDLNQYLKKQPSVQGSSAGQVYLGGRLNKLFDKAMTEAAQLRDEYVSAEHLLVVMAEEKEGQAGKILSQAGITRDSIFKVLVDIRGNQRVTDPNPEGKYQALERYAKDFNELARTGKFDPVIGRDDEIRRIMQVLSRRPKNHPVLIGEPGAGKTATVEGLPQRLVTGDEGAAVDEQVVEALGGRPRRFAPERRRRHQAASVEPAEQQAEETEADRKVHHRSLGHIQERVVKQIGGEVDRHDFPSAVVLNQRARPAASDRKFHPALEIVVALACSAGHAGVALVKVGKSVHLDLADVHFLHRPVGAGQHAVEVSLDGRMPMTNFGIHGGEGRLLVHQGQESGHIGLVDGLHGLVAQFAQRLVVFVIGLDHLGPGRPHRQQHHPHHQELLAHLSGLDVVACGSCSGKQGWARAALLIPTGGGG